MHAKYLVLPLAGCASLLTWVLLPGTTKPVHLPLSKLLAATSPQERPTAPDHVMGNALSKIPTPSDATTQLQNDGVAVTVDGRSVALSDIASRAVGFEHNDIENAGFNALAAGMDEQSAVDQVQSFSLGIRQSVAFEVLSELANQTAVTNGSAVTAAQAAAIGAQNYEEYLKDYNQPSPYTTPLSPPSENEFTSPQAIAAYQFERTVTQEMAAIAGPATSTSRTLALASWLDQQITVHTITVAGVPGVTPSNLGSFLPPGL